MRVLQLNYWSGQLAEISMKTYDELKPEQQVKACEKALAKILEKICDGSAVFPGNPDMQRKIEATAIAAERMKTPWFMHEFVLDSCKVELETFARNYARAAFYREPGDLVLTL